MTIEIKTNNIPRETFIGAFLSDDELKEFDWMVDPESSLFFRYKGRVYALDDFMTVYEDYTPLSEWDGYVSDTYFSGVVVKFRDDKVIVGEYFVK